MSTVKAKKSIGFFIIAVAAVVGIVGIALYGKSYSTNSKAYGFMIAAVIVAAVALVIGQVAGNGAVLLRQAGQDNGSVHQGEEAGIAG